MVGLQLAFNLLILESLVLEVQMHVSYVLSEGLLNLSHSESPNTARVVDLGDVLESYIFWQ